MFVKVETWLIPFQGVTASCLLTRLRGRLHFSLLPSKQNLFVEVSLRRHRNGGHPFLNLGVPSGNPGSLGTRLFRELTPGGVLSEDETPSGVDFLGSQAKFPVSDPVYLILAICLFRLFY